MEALIEILFGWIFGGLILKMIGGWINWIYYAIRASIAGRPRISLKDAMSNKRLVRREQRLYGGLSNGLVGLIVILLTAALFVKLSLMFGW